MYILYVNLWGYIDKTKEYKLLQSLLILFKMTISVGY